MKDMDFSALLTGGGSAGLVLALAYIGRLVLDWSSERGRAPLTKTTSAVSDASTANAALVKTLEGLQAENQRLRDRVQHLEEHDRNKDQTIERLQNELQRISDELIALKGRRA